MFQQPIFWQFSFENGFSLPFHAQETWSSIFHWMQRQCTSVRSVELEPFHMYVILVCKYYPSMRYKLFMNKVISMAFHDFFWCYQVCIGSIGDGNVLRIVYGTFFLLFSYFSFLLFISWFQLSLFSQMWQFVLCKAAFPFMLFSWDSMEVCKVDDNSLINCFYIIVKTHAPLAKIPDWSCAN